jgi:hypothetical protein
MYADFAMREKKYEEAFDLAQQSLEIAKGATSTNPWVSAALYFMGYIRLMQGKTEQARCVRNPQGIAI